MKDIRRGGEKRGSSKIQYGKMQTFRAQSLSNTLAFIATTSCNPLFSLSIAFVRDGSRWGGGGGGGGRGVERLGLCLQGGTERTFPSSARCKAREGGVRHPVEMICRGNRIITKPS